MFGIDIHVILVVSSLHIQNQYLPHHAWSISCRDWTLSTRFLFQSNIQRRLITVIANLFLQIANAMGIMNSTSRLVTIRFNAERQFTVLITMRVYVLWNRTKWIVIVLIIVGLSTETTAAILFLYSSVKGTCKLFLLSFAVLSKAHERRYAVTYVES